MVQVSLQCPFCQTTRVICQTTRVTKYGKPNGKQRYKCHNAQCSHKTFYAKYTYNAYKHDVKKQIIKMAINGNGIRAIAHVLEISPDAVIATLKKKKPP